MSEMTTALADRADARSEDEAPNASLSGRAREIFDADQLANYRRTDRWFAALMVVQWVAGLVAAVVLSPRSWAGSTSAIHPHVYAAILVGGLAAVYPIALALVRPGETLTRHVIAAGQMLMSALLIHLSGGRIETHFHVFGSLAFLAFYRDWRVMVTATAVVALDHVLRGAFWPQSVYGVASATPWRAVEHAAWVLFEDAFLAISIRASLEDLSASSQRRARLETTNLRIEREVADRTVDLVRAREEALEAARVKAEFLANMSHEIRTPMNAIMGMTELSLGTELSREQREYLETTRTSSESLLTLLNDILDLSKIEAGKLELEAVPFSLNTCVGGALRTVRMRAHEKDLELTCRIAPQVSDAVVGDPGRLRQILINLMGNAIKFTERGEVVVQVERVSGDESESTLHFSVTDTGIGIPPDKQRLIFDSFTQADGSTTRHYGGTGLGLAICRRLVLMMGGAIEVQSEPGQGSTFSFDTRLGLQDLETIVQEPAPTRDLAGRRVLVVDDNATNRWIMTEILEGWGVTVACASDAPAALAALRGATEAPFDLALLDVCMPGADGFELAESIRREPALAGTTLVMLTSAARSGDAERCKTIGVTGYLTKPVLGIELFDALRSVLGLAQAGADSVLVTRSTLDDALVSMRILLAEDNPVNTMVAVRLLEKRGHQVVAVPDGARAIEALERERFDVVLMDVQMPVMDGIEATTRIREAEKSTGAHVPIVALTAHAMRGDDERCLAAGMDTYVRKPFKPDELFSTIERLARAA